MVAALAVLAPGCRQAEQGVGDVPRAAAPQGMNEVTKAPPQAGGMRLSFSGVGVPPRSGPVGGAAARLSGVLARLGDCLVVTAPNGSRVQPVFRAGKAVWDEAAGALIFAGKSYRLRLMPGKRAWKLRLAPKRICGRSTARSGAAGDRPGGGDDRQLPNRGVARRRYVRDIGARLGKGAFR
jgi:hypothetical protein